MKSILAVIYFVLITVIVFGDNIPDKYFKYQGKRIAYEADYDFCSKSKSVRDKVLKVVIVIHGSNRNALTYYGNMNLSRNYLSAINLLSTDETYVIAPHFPTRDDIPDKKSKYFRWLSYAWKEGGNCAYPPLKGVSSFEIMDDLFDNMKDYFPNLKHIVMIGHSAGGQFVNRYAAGSKVHNNIEASGIDIRYIVANPSSYLYLNNDRARETDLGFDYTTEQFEDADKEYSEYKYGIRKMNSYMKDVGKEKIRDNYEKRLVVYLIGDLDLLRGENFDDKEIADKQGYNRFERCNIYYNYLQHYYGADIVQNHIKAILFRVGHSSFDVFNSNLGRFFIFYNGDILGNNYVLYKYDLNNKINSYGSSLPIEEYYQTYKDDFKAYKNLYAGNISGFNQKIGTVIGIDTDIRFRAGENVYLIDEFKAENGCEFKAYIKEFVGFEFLTSPIQDSVIAIKPGLRFESGKMTEQRDSIYNIETIEGCMFFSDTISVVSSDVPEIEIFGKLSIYPNPSGNKFMVENELGKAELKMYNTAGQEIYNCFVGNGAMEINIPSLKDGAYIIRIFASGKTYTFTHIIQK